jgi:hypothetical protein
MDEELQKELQAIADDKDVLLLSFVAPDRAIRISPIGVAETRIDVADLYAIEKTIEDLQEVQSLPKTLHLIIHTLGGVVYVSTKIANYLRNTFDEIHAFVPYEAASGGTVLCLAANRITMGAMANLTPIDPQTKYQSQWVSTTSYQFAIIELEARFEKMLPLEIPPPWQQLCEKLDPVILKEMNNSWRDTFEVAFSLLKRSYKPETDEQMETVRRTARSLAFSTRPHDHIIDSTEAKHEFSLNIDNSDENMKTLRVYKKWVKSMLEKEQSTHVIEHIIPTKAKAKRSATNESK